MMAFEIQPLARLRSTAVPLLEMLYASPHMAYVVLLAPLLGAVVIVGWLGSVSKVRVLVWV